MNMVIPGIHSNKNKRTEKVLPKDVPAINNDPIWNFKVEKYVHDPMWVYPLKGFCKVQ